jgi:single-strand DNA-binding protein
MANLNKVMLMGNLTRDPELRYTPKGTAVTDISMAINRIWNNEQNQRQEDTIFVEVTLWGRQAEIAQQYLSKGRGVFIEGRLQMDTWEDKASGQKRSKLKVVGETLHLLPSGGGGTGGGAHANSSSASSRPAQMDTPQGGSSMEESGFHQEEDDIPF